MVTSPCTFFSFPEFPEQAGRQQQVRAQSVTQKERNSGFPGVFPGSHLPSRTLLQYCLGHRPQRQKWQQVTHKDSGNSHSSGRMPAQPHPPEPPNSAAWLLPSYIPGEKSSGRPGPRSPDPRGRHPGSMALVSKPALLMHIWLPHWMDSQTDRQTICPLPTPPPSRSLPHFNPGPAQRTLTSLLGKAMPPPPNLAFSVSTGKKRKCDRSSISRNQYEHRQTQTPLWHVPVGYRRLSQGLPGAEHSHQLTKGQVLARCFAMAKARPRPKTIG